MERIEAESEHHLRGTWVRRLGMSLDEIAIHEAAHATIAWVTGRGVLGVSMVTDAQFKMLGRHPRRGISLGCTDFPPLPALSLDDRRYRLLAEREAMIGLSGDLAVRKFRGTPLMKAPTPSDVTMASYAAALAGTSQKSVDACLNRVATRTALYLDIYWGHVRRLAERLLERRTLSGGEVVDLLRGVDR